MLDIETIRYNYQQAIARHKKMPSSTTAAGDQAECDRLFQAAEQGIAQLREALASSPLDPGPFYLVVAGQFKEQLGGPDPDPLHIPHTFG
jgi:hypothetical protein